MDVELPALKPHPGGEYKTGSADWMKLRAGCAEAELFRLRRRVVRAEQELRTARALVLVLLVLGLGAALGFTFQSTGRAAMAAGRREAPPAPVTVIERHNGQLARQQTRVALRSDPARLVLASSTPEAAGARARASKPRRIPALPPAAFGSRAAGDRQSRIAALFDRQPRRPSTPPATHAAVKPSSSRMPDRHICSAAPRRPHWRRRHPLRRTHHLRRYRHGWRVHYYRYRHHHRRHRHRHPAIAHLTRPSVSHSIRKGTAKE